MQKQNMPTSQLLNRAADLIIQRGWSRGNGWNEGDGETTPLCLEGGILAAQGLRYKDLDEVTLRDLVICPAYKAVQEYLEFEEELWRWNDYTFRTEQEVIDVLRHVAALEAVKEASAERDEISAAFERLAALYVPLD